MQEKVVLRIVTVAALIILAVTLVHAGSGGGGNPVQVTYECLTLSKSENVGETVSISLVGGAVVHPSAQINNGVLSCRQVEVRQGNALLNPTLGDHLKCYTISAAASGANPQNLTLTDMFVPTGDAVRIGVASQYLCTSAFLGQ